MKEINIENFILYCKVKTVEGFKTVRLYYNVKDVRLKINYDKYYLVETINFIDGLITITVPCNLVSYKNNVSEDMIKVIFGFHQVEFFYLFKKDDQDNFIELSF